MAPQLVEIMASVYYNAGVQYEFLGQASECLIYFDKAVHLCQLHLGETNPTSVMFKNHYDDAKNRIANGDY